MKPYSLERNGPECRLTLTADLVAANAEELKAELKCQIESGATEVILDLGQTSLLDSSGIGLLIATYNTLNRKQGRLTVANTPTDIFELLRGMRLVERLNVRERQN